MVEERYPALKRILKAPAAYAEPEIRAASSDVTEKRSSGPLTECYDEHGLLPVCIKCHERQIISVCAVACFASLK